MKRWTDCGPSTTAVVVYIWTVDTVVVCQIAESWGVGAMTDTDKRLQTFNQFIFRWLSEKLVRRKVR